VVFTRMSTIMKIQRHANCGRFAAANGWRVGKSFTRDCLIGGKIPEGGRCHDDDMIIDRTEWFTLGRYPVAIIGHNYQEDVEKLKQLPAVLDGRLSFIHTPPAGKAASWYYPGASCRCA